MDLQTILSFTLFAAVSAFTPGPNNIMLAASGANFGFRASLPHILGISIGFISLVIGAGFGLANLFAAFPDLYDIMKIFSFMFLIYIAWRIGSAGHAQTQRPSEPLRFWQAAVFQLVNPKGVSVIIVRTAHKQCDHSCRRGTVLCCVLCHRWIQYNMDAIRSGD